MLIWFELVIDCKTDRIFAYSSTRALLARFARMRLLRHALSIYSISLLILRKKPTVLQSKLVMV